MANTIARYFWPSDEYVRWRLLPAQPLMYLFLFGATIWGLFTDRPHDLLYLDSLGLYVSWSICGIFSPLLFGVASYLVLRTDLHNRWLRFGLYWRLAADVGMFTYLAIICLAELIPAYGDHELVHTALMLFAVTFVGLELVRDVWTIIKVERWLSATKGVDESQ